MNLGHTFCLMKVCLRDSIILTQGGLIDLKMG